MGKPSEDFVELHPWRSTIKAPSDWSKQHGSRILNFAAPSPAVPDSSLELEHVFGYRGLHSRDALWVSGSGRLVRFCAVSCVLLVSRSGRSTCIGVCVEHC